MNRRVLAIAVVLILCVTLGTFAAEKKSSTIPWLVAFNSAGTTDVAVGVGYSYYGFSAQADLNLTFGQFDIGPIPLSWGAAVAAGLGFGFDLGFGAGAFVTLDTGFDFGGGLKFEWRLGIGPAVSFDIGGYYYSLVPFGLGIGQYFSWTWWFSNNFGLTAQELYGSSFFGPSFYAYTLGVELKL
jgi:hypothetical protein